MLKKLEIVELFTRLKEQNPSPQTELEYTNNFTLLVAVVLSAQATDRGVNKATKELFKIADSPEKILALQEEGLKEHIKTIGLFNSKAKNIIALCEALIKEHNSKVPDDMDSLIKLAGVGRKTANVILNTAFRQPAMAVDTHIFRVSNRLGLTKAKNVVESEKQLLKKIPDEFILDAHHWLILHGRYICKARKPLCSKCIINDICQYKAKEL